MRRINAVAAGIVMIGGVAYIAMPRAHTRDTDSAVGNAVPGATNGVQATSPIAPRPPLSAADEKFYRDAAAAAWKYFDNNYQSATGLVNASPDWHYTTMWDVGGQMLAFLSARDVGLITTEDYRARVQKVLATVQRMPLYDRGAYNKTYSATDGSAGDGKKGLTGWSATDLGRFLIAAKIVSTRDPELAPAAEQAVRRIQFSQVVKGGYLYGRLNGSTGKPWSFQEGRIGYEQYSAQGFGLWGAKASNAATVATNAYPVDVLGVKLVGDKRKLDRLNSEPFVLLGLELGLPTDMRDLGASVLKAQQVRFEKTGKVTMASEDAVSVAPHYFYYYCVFANGKPFVVDIVIPGSTMDSPRWVSTKAAFGWHAIMPNDYTKRALDLVAKTRTDKGWASGVYEGDGKSTGTLDINTSAVVLEAAAYQLRGGKPLITP